MRLPTDVSNLALIAGSNRPRAVDKENRLRERATGSWVVHIGRGGWSAGAYTSWSGTTIGLA